MFGFFEKKKNKSTRAVKVVLACVAVVSAIGAAVTAFLIWKEKKEANKYGAEAIDSIIDEELGDDDAEFSEEEVTAE